MNYHRFSSCIFAVAILAGTSNLVQAEAPQTMEGNWKLLGYDVNGKSTVPGWELYGIYKANSKWQFNAGGTGDCGGTEVKWTYDPAINKLDLQISNIFGFWCNAIGNARVVLTPAGVDVFTTQLGQNMVFHLASLDPKPVVTADLEWTDATVDREVFEETIETIRGLPKKLTVRREYEASINASETKGVQAGGGFSVGPKMVASISVELKAKMEVTLGITIGKKDEVTETYELDGDKVLKVKVKWVERYRRGIMKMSDGSQKVFLVCVGLRTIPEKLP